VKDFIATLDIKLKVESCAGISET